MCRWIPIQLYHHGTRGGSRVSLEWRAKTLSCLNTIATDDGFVAEGAFRAVQDYFQQSRILTREQKTLITRSQSMEDVQSLVTATLGKYEATKASSKIRRWLERTSEIICHYGTILDVFVQHHPEYVSLAWGALKLIFSVGQSISNRNTQEKS